MSPATARSTVCNVRILRRSGAVALLLFTCTLLAAFPALARRGSAAKNVLSLSDRARYNLPTRAKRRAIHQFGLKRMALRQGFLGQHNTRYTTEVPGGPPHKVRDQHSSGRCWIFATDRVLQSKLRKKGRDAPALSASFANYHALRQKSRSLLDRAVAGERLQPSSLGEGGWQPWAIDIVRKHGFVPEKKMPSSVDANSSGVALTQLKTLLAGAQQQLDRVGDGPDAKAQRKAIARRYKGEVDQLLAATIGKPPSRFHYKGKRYTPRTFASKHLGLTEKDLDYVMLSHDTTHGWNRRYTVSNEAMGDFEVYNVSADKMQRAVKKTIRSGEAVWVGSHVSSNNPYRIMGNEPNMPDKAKGVASLRAFNYGKFIPQERISKRTRVKSGVTLANHAMAIVGYDTGGKRRGHKRGSVLKWKVENSWGTSAGDGGFWHMYDGYFRQYADVVAVPRSALPKGMLRKIESRPVVEEW